MEIVVSMNLGAGRSLQTVAAAFNDLAVVCQFASELQREDAGVVVRGFPVAEPYAEADPYSIDLHDLIVSGDAPSFSYQWNRRSEISRLEGEGAPDFRLLSATYQNPIEWVLLIAGGAVTVWVLRLIRDWPARRRLNDAVVFDYENRALARQRAREIVLNQLERGEIQLTERQVDALLSGDVLDAMSALGDAPLEVRGLDREGR